VNRVLKRSYFQGKEEYKSRVWLVSLLVKTAGEAEQRSARKDKYKYHSEPSSFVVRLRVGEQV
jgi:hypothetical protein